MNRQILSRLLIFGMFTGCVLFGNSCSKDPIDSGNGTFNDSRDNYTYQWVKIGTQNWMSKNLAFLPDVSPSANGSDTVACNYVYNYESSYVSTAKDGPNYQAYGVLYNWISAQTACPEGWHLPSDSEWDVLANFLGGDSLAGNRLKSISGWNEKGNGDNTSGFNALPGGYRSKDFGFDLLGENAGFWTATPADSAGTSIVRDLGYNYVDFGRGSYSNSGGFSIRCLKNNH